MVISQTNGFNWHWKFFIALFEQFHHFTCEFSWGNSVEKFAMVICTYTVPITMEDFTVRNIVFQRTLMASNGTRSLL